MRDCFFDWLRRYNTLIFVLYACFALYLINIVDSGWLRFMLALTIAIRLLARDLHRRAALDDD